MAGDRSPELLELGMVIVEASTNASAEPWPAIVDSYDDTTLRAKVTPSPRPRDKKSGAAYTLGPLSVPVLWPGWGPVTIQGVLEKGDEVLLIPCAPAILAWLSQGGITDSEGPGRTLGQAFAVPIRASVARKPGPTGGDTVIGRDDGGATVIITVAPTGVVKIQAPSVVLGSEVPPKLPVGRDTDPVNTNAAFTAWRTNVEAGLAAGVPIVVPPLVGTAIGNIAATSTEVTSS